MDMTYIIFRQNPESVNIWSNRLLFHVCSLLFQTVTYYMIAIYLYLTNSKMRESVVSHFGIDILLTSIKDKIDSILDPFIF